MNRKIIEAIMDSFEDTPELKQRYSMVRDELQNLLDDSGVINHLMDMV